MPGLSTSDPGLIPLTARGQEQAVRLSEMWPSTPSAIVTSQYARAIDTARPLSTRFELVPTINPLLHEFVMLDPDQVVGTTVHERRPMVDGYWAKSDPTCRMGDGAETFREFAARVDGYRVYELHGSGAAAWRLEFNAKISRQMPTVGDPGLTIQ